MRPVSILLLVTVGCGLSRPALEPPKNEPPAPTPIAGLPGAVRIRFEPASQGFFDVPWPTVLRQDAASGLLDLSRFPGRDEPVIGDAIAESDGELHGYSVAPVIYFGLSAALDQAEVDAAIGEAVVLLDVDPQSPERGRRVPLHGRYYAAATRFVPAHTLALRPLSGSTLRGGTLYAAVVRRKLGRTRLGTSASFERLKRQVQPADAAEREIHQRHAAGLATVASAVGLDDVAGLAMFRTQEPAAPLTALMKAAGAVAEKVKLLEAGWEPKLASPSYQVIRGYYCTPAFQQGLAHAPFASRGGRMARPPAVEAVSPGGRYHDPACAPLLSARFVLAVPRGEMPAGGWPLMVYAHGTTGDAFSVLGDDGFASRAAAAGIASVSTDQPLHGGDDARGARPGSREPYTFKIGPITVPVPLKGKGGELGFFNVLRPTVLRDNLRQAMVDAHLLVHRIAATDFARATAPGGGRLWAGDGPAPRFARHFVAAGHSQGCYSAATLGALDGDVRAALLSACGGDFATSMLRRADAQAAIKTFSFLLDLAPGELDGFHPFITLLQTTLDPVDPASFGRAYRGGGRDVLLVEGIGDSMTTSAAYDALAGALRAQPIAPLLRSYPLAASLDIRPAATVTGNLGGKATIALLQVRPDSGYDGHYVAFNDLRARRLLEQFLRGARQPGPIPVGP